MYAAKKACTACTGISRALEWLIWRLIYRRFAKALLNDKGYPMEGSATFWADHVRAGITKGLKMHNGNLSYAVACVYGYDTTTKRFQLGGLAAELACASLSVNLLEPLLGLSSSIRGEVGSAEKGSQICLADYTGTWVETGHTASFLLAAAHLRLINVHHFHAVDCCLPEHWDAAPGQSRLQDDTDVVNLHLDYAQVLQTARLIACGAMPSLSFSCSRPFCHYAKNKR